MNEMKCRTEIEEFVYSINSMSYTKEDYWRDRFTYCKASTKKELSGKLMYALGYIEDHFLSKDLTIDEISKKCFVSKFHFFRCFKEAFDLSPYQYLLNKKLGYAALMIITDESISLKDVSLLIGFSDVFTFSKAFKRKFKLSPSSYRKEMTGKLGQLDINGAVLRN